MTPLAISSRRGAWLIAAATVCWSSGGIIVRLVEADGWTIVFWRAVFLALSITTWLFVRYGRAFMGPICAMGQAGIVSGLLLAASFIFYILAITHTTVANTLVLMSASPLVAAVLGRFVLGEPLTWQTLAAIVLALAGILTMVTDGLAGGGLVGNLCALVVAVCFGSNIVVMRAQPQVDMVPATLVGGIFALLIALPLAAPFSVTRLDFALLALMGSVQLGLGLFLFVIGARHLPSAEVGLLTLLEMVLAPIWVWVGVGETPAFLTFVGGFLILLALVGHALLTGRADVCGDTGPPAS